MNDEKKTNPHPQKMRWTTVLSTPDFATARAKADATQGAKIKRRPNGTFDVRTGVPVKEAKEEA